MYLKTIEIQGFKSFANKTVFEFHNGITGIVGPNGSGKSNVADAVRWVLGEQSAKQLRGSSMQDVIFAGTEIRKPQGFASVAITFDNTDRLLNIDFSEVTVLRRVYRSGESEYRINGSVCRLRDIHELFFDTGIGKEGYSIIGQGQIDKILSTRPEDRRELFDEAAGIVKFKYRKQMSERRLETEQENRTRLGDILAELEKQLGPLQRQSETAKEYLTLRDGLKQEEVNCFVFETGKREEELAEIEKNLRIQNEDLEETRDEAEQLKKQYAAKQEELDGLNAALSGIAEKIEETRTAISRTEEEIRSSEEAIRTEGLRREISDKRIEVLLGNLDSRRKELEELGKQRQELNNQIYDVTSKKARLEHYFSDTGSRIEENRKQQDRGRKQHLDLINKKNAVYVEEQKYQTTLEQYKIRRAGFNKELLENRRQEENCRAEEENCRIAYNKAESILAETRTFASQKQKEYRDRLKKEEDCRRLFSEQKQNVQILKNRTESVRNLAERYDGYGMSVRKIMEVKSQYPGICGLVADLIHVKKKYETAIETALGGSIQNVVTDSEETAKELITYLKKNRLGRATFLPLDAITVREEFRQKEALSEPGILGIASQLVETAPGYQTIMEFLLGRILVADTIEHAMKTAAKYKRSFRIVTLEGDLLNIGGSMTGGTYRNTSSLLSRGRELEELEKSLKEAEVLYQRYEEELRQVSSLRAQAEEALNEARELCQTQSLSETEARLKLDAAKRRLEEVIRQKENIQIEQRLLEKSISEIKDKKDGCAERIREYEEEARRILQGTEDSGKEEEQLKEESRLTDLDIREASLELTRLQSREDFLKENQNRICQDQDRDQSEYEELTREQTRQSERILGDEKEIRIRKEVLDESRLRQKSLIKEQEEKSSRRDRIHAGLKGFFERQEELSEEINDLDRDIIRLNHQKEKCEEFLDSQTSYLWNEYELRPSEARKLAKTGDTTLTASQVKAQQLRRKIKDLGPININAIEEYRDMSQRYEFMKGQYDDLIESEKSLAGVIEELDRGMRAQFEEQFQKIRESFEKVFRELFGGGHGSLELAEDEDVIEAGIMINAQPPGKKLQNMMQLSGGERALTAIALLFAIQDLKPSPFCLLDEIEAALDDANVTRFAKYLHRLSKTQFIVITHRRGTMTAADRLYGITMQEKGVSALVSVSLVEDSLK